MLDIKPGRILLGVADENAEGAVEYAAAEARRRHVGVHVVHVVPMLALGSAPDTATLRGDVLVKVGAGLLADVAGRLEHELGEDLPVTTEIHDGSAAPALVAESQHAGLVVLQRRRHGLPGHVPTLSVTSGVATHGHAPVVVVPQGWHADPERDGLVVVGVGDVAVAADVVGLALADGRARSGRVRFVHAWSYNAAYDDLVFEGAAGREHESGLRHDLERSLVAPLQGFEDVPTEVLVAHARPADLLVAQSRPAGLVVLGRHHPAAPWPPHLGSVVRAVLREAESPVAVVGPATWAADG